MHARKQPCMLPAGITRHMSSRAVVCASKGAHACPQKSRSGIAAERLRSPSVSAPHWESLARPTGPGLLTYLIVPKVPKVHTQHATATHKETARPVREHVCRPGDVV